MNKFIAGVTGSSGDIKGKRAGILASSTKSAQERIVNSLQDELNQVELDIENITDIAPENTYDLRPGGKGFKPTEWADRLQELKVEKYRINIELGIAKDTLEEWFTDEKDSIVKPDTTHG